MPYREKQIEKKYWSIGDLADELGVATSLIRFWETEFKQLKPRKNRKGRRQYNRKDREVLRQIYHLVKVQGHTLAGAREVLVADGDLLDRWLKSMPALSYDDMQAAIDYLDSKMNSMNTETK